MALPVREGASPLGRIHDEIDRMFQEFTTSRFWPRIEGATRVPALDVYEKNGNLVVEAELPGIDKKGVKISYTDSTVTIQGETKSEKEETKEGYLPHDPAAPDSGLRAGHGRVQGRRARHHSPEDRRSRGERADDCNLGLGPPAGSTAPAK